jgi:hypothetical protein
MRAVARNCGNQSLRCKGRSTSGQIREAREPKRSNWGGPTRMSDEGPVIGLEQRGRVRWLHQRNNWQQDELDACDKQTVQHR